MAKKTLLEMVQGILSDMDSDEVNSISDTVESLQVANIIRNTYEALVATLSIPERRELVRLEGVADVSRPNYLKIPDDVKDIMWIKYNGVDIHYITPSDFINRVLTLSGDFEVTDFGDVTYSIPSDADPQYWTTFDDTYCAFDSFNIENESTLQQSNSLAYAEMNSNFVLEDSFIPDLDDNLFPLLYSKAKSTCFIDLKQVSNTGSERDARQQLVRVQNELSRSATSRPSDRLPDYGRRR